MVLEEIVLTECFATLIYFTFHYILRFFWSGQDMFILIKTTLYHRNYVVRIFPRGRQRKIQFSFFAKHSISGHRCCFRAMHWSCVVPSNISYTLYSVLKPTRCTFWFLFLKNILKKINKTQKMHLVGFIIQGTSKRFERFKFGIF